MQKDPADLPGSARQLVSAIGYPAALALIQGLGGRTVAFSKGKRADGQAQYERIAEIVGYEAAGLLADRFGGAPVYIPRCAKALREERNRRIREEYDAGTRHVSARSAVDAIADRYAITDRHAWRIVNGK
jgi:hypothetical protein